MDELKLDPLARVLVEGYCANPKHALLLRGEKGTGTFTTAMAIVKKLKISPENIILIQPEKNTIPIDTIRSLYASTRSSRDHALMVIIDDADAMGSDAQNALLKLLEEPPKMVFFILTTHHDHQLLDTVLSRTEHITLQLIDRQESLKFVEEQGVTDSSLKVKLLFLASGRPAELFRLIMNPEYFTSSSTRMGDARRFLEEDRYGRLVLLKKYTNDRIEAEAFLMMIGQLLSHSLYRNVSENSLKAMNAVNDALESLSKNGNVRAQLLRLSNSLS